MTGFGPFPTMPRNPSGATARRLAASPRWRVLGVAAEARVLTTSYAALDDELTPALRTMPDAVLMTGVAGRARAVRVERRGTSRRSVLFADASGTRPKRVGEEGRTPVRRSSAPLEAARLALRRHRLPATLSRDAGRYLCNAAYYRALAAPCPVLFVHIPKTPRADRPTAAHRHRGAPSDRLHAALFEIGVSLLRQARRRNAGRD